MGVDIKELIVQAMKELEKQNVPMDIRKISLHPYVIMFLKV